MARVGKMTLDWLEKYEVPYDEIFFWKPNGDIYIDDKAKTFIGWDDTRDIDNYDESRVNIVIPMAWAWSRFSKAWYDVPKPLIEAFWKPMFEWAASSFSFLEEKYTVKYIFIVLQEHIDTYNVDVAIKKIYPDSVIIPLASITRWQAETVLMAKEYISDLNRLIIFNADTFSVYNPEDFPIADPRIDGLIACFDSNDPRYSYAHLDSYGYVDEVVEKVVISSNATNGMYYFRTGVDFVNFAQKMISRNELSKWEFYVWPMYTDLIKAWKRVKINSIKENWILGTPEELDYFLNNYVH
jgi:dTDP-glucose pyrophosphorylase